MDTTFLELAQAVRDTHTIGLQTLARLVDIADPDDLETMRARKARLLEAANMLVEIAPHEVLVRSILRIGALADFPEYSPNPSGLRVGGNGLWRGEVLDIMPTECEVRFKTQRATSRTWISRANLIGLETTRPSMWLNPAR